MSISKTIFFLILIFSLKNFASSRSNQTFQKSWQYYLKKGLLQYKLEMYDYSILNLQKALEQNDKLFKAANTLAEIYKINRDKKKAIDYYNISLEIKNPQAETHFKIAELYEFFAEYNLAFEHYKKSIRIDPLHIKSNLSLVRFYLKKNNDKMAKKHFSISYKAGWEISKDYFKTAEDEWSNKNFNRAIKYYKKAIDINPALLKAYIAIYRIYNIKKKYKEAANIIEKLKFVKPDYERAYIFLANIYYNRRLPGKRTYYINRAIFNLKKLIKINPGNSDALYTMWQIYSRLGKDQEAKKYMKKWELVESFESGKN